MDNSKRKTPPPRKRERNEEICETETDKVVSVQPIARVEVVAVQIPPIVVVVPDIEHVGVTVVRMCEAPPVPPPFEYSEGRKDFGI